MEKSKGLSVEEIAKIEGATKKLFPDLEAAKWPPTSGVIISDEDFPKVHVALMNALPEKHREAATILLGYIDSEMKKTDDAEDPTSAPAAGGRRRRRVRGGVEPRFLLKCMFIALMEVIADAASEAPKLFVQLTGVAAVGALLVTHYTGGVGAAAGAVVITKKIMDLYYSFTNVEAAARGVEDAAAAAAAVAEDVEHPIERMLPLRPLYTGPTELFRFIPSQAPAPGEEVEDVPAAQVPISPQDAWMRVVQSNPDIAGAHVPEAVVSFETKAQRIVIAVIAAVYLRKLASVMARQTTYDLQERLLRAQVAAAERLAVQQPAEVVGADAARIMRMPAMQPVQTIESDPLGGRRRRTMRRRRTHRRRPSAPTRKVPSSSRRSRPIGQRRG